MIPPVLSAARTYGVPVDQRINTYGLAQPNVATWQKDPASTLDYTVDWGQWLVDAGDTILNSSVVAAPELTIGAQALVNGTMAVVMLSGSTLGAFTVTFTIHTAAGRIDERTILLEVTNR